MSSPAAKRAKLSSQSQISDLADADLSAVFQRLPPYDRLIASEVSRRWYELSRKQWLDISKLDLSPIPGKHIGAIVRQCPNLQSVFALKKSFGSSELAALSKSSSLATVKLYDCTFAVKGDLSADCKSPNDVLAKVFSETLQHSSFRELILHGVCFDDKSVSSSSRSVMTKWALSASFLPASLTRLQLSHLDVKRGIVDSRDLVLKGLDRLENLECLMLLESTADDCFLNDNLSNATSVFPRIIERICTLKHLRELAVGPYLPFIARQVVGRLTATLPKLEVLFLHDVYSFDATEDLADLVTKKSALRILVFSGHFYLPTWLPEIVELPARNLYPNGFGSDPLPLLHIFVGKEASEGIRFATSPSDAAIIHTINEPMPQFLEREDIASIFEGVWLAEKIKETAKFGGSTSGFSYPLAMSYSASIAKKAKLSSQTQISHLADADLSAIFERLPPYDRLIASEVSRRWCELSRKAWLEVTELDLSPIPEKHIGAVVKLCPNLQTVFAHKKSFELNELAILSRSNSLCTVKLYDCKFAVKSDPDASVINDGFAKIFSENLQHASWSEFVLHNAYVDDKSVVSSGNTTPQASASARLSESFTRPKWVFSAACLPTSLTRLQLSGLRITDGVECCSELFLNELQRLQNLECLILYETGDSYRCCNSDEFTVVHMFYALFERVYALKNLKELCVKPAMPIVRSHERLFASLPKLQVLFLDDLSRREVGNDLRKLISKNSVLRILVFCGDFNSSFSKPHPIGIPARMRFPNGFGSDPLPLLHVFVGRDASEQLHFKESSSDAAAFYPINQPMPKFLERDDIAPIFEGVWVAEQIKELAKIGGRLWDYELCDRATSLNAVSFEQRFWLNLAQFAESNHS